MNELTLRYTARGGQLNRRGGGAPPPPPSGGAWPGDPGDGEYLIGWSMDYGTGGWTPTTMASAPGFPAAKMSVLHDYSNNGNGISTSRLDSAISRGYIPSQSIKLSSWSFAQVASGAADAAIDTNIVQVALDRAPWPIWLCYYHEPEDITATADKTNYRAATRRMVQRCRTAGVTNIAWHPIFTNPWTFVPASDGGTGDDWRLWHADWDPVTGWNDDLTMDMFGADTYNPLPTSPGRDNKGFLQMWQRLFDAVEKPGYPVWDYVQPEFGMSYQATPQPDWNAWSIEARDIAKAHRIKSFCYWDNSDDIGRYRLAPPYDSTGDILAGWNTIVNAAIVWPGP